MFKDSSSRERGFTLLEIMIVLAIVAGMVVLASPYLTNRNSQVKAFLREMTVLSRELHTKAKLNGVAYRLVIDLSAPGDGNEEPQQTLWVERSNSRSVVASSEDPEDVLRRSSGDDEKKKSDPKGFEMDTQIIKKPKRLPPGLRFDRVELTRLKNPVVEGQAFIHYLPEGLVDEAAVHIKGEGKQAWTIAIHPLTGKAELISRTLSLKEIRSQ